MNYDRQNNQEKERLKLKMSASNELEKAATAYALDAVRLDKQGQKGRAITLYQKAIESLCSWFSFTQNTA